MEASQEVKEVSMFEAVKNVMQHHGIPVATEVTLPHDLEFDFRARFLLEEINELADAFMRENIVDMADALADIVTVAMGLAASMGIPLDKVCEIVNQANLTGKQKVSSASESKRGYAHDLYKTADFVSPEPAIAKLLFGDDHGS